MFLPNQFYETKMSTLFWIHPIANVHVQNKTKLWKCQKKIIRGWKKSTLFFNDSGKKRARQKQAKQGVLALKHVFYAVTFLYSNEQKKLIPRISHCAIAVPKWATYKNQNNQFTFSCTRLKFPLKITKIKWNSIKIKLKHILTISNQFNKKPLCFRRERDANERCSRLTYTGYRSWCQKCAA